MADARIQVQGRIELVVADYASIVAYQNQILNDLTARGWRVEAVSLRNTELRGAGGGWVFGLGVSVVGSSQDSLTAVARAMSNALIGMGVIGVSNFTASWTGAPQQVPQQVPQTTQPPANVPRTGSRILLLRVYGQNPFWTTFSVSGVIDNVRNALTANNIGVNSINDISPTRANQSYVTLAVAIDASQGSDSDIINLVRIALSGVLTDLSVNLMPNAGAPNDNTQSGIDNILSTIGNAVGLEAKSAVIGGAVVAGILLLVLLKSK